MDDIALFYDTETTGLPLFEQPSEDPRQPHLVQLGAALVHLKQRRILASLDLIIKPDGWTIPDEVSRIHGITTKRAADEGVPEKLAAELFLELWQSRRPRVAHNESFDARILRIALKRHHADQADPWKVGAAHCTARLSTPILKLPPTDRMRAAKRFHHKTPNLGEAYQHFTGKPLVGAHSAMVDVRACIEVWYGIHRSADDTASTTSSQPAEADA